MRYSLAQLARRQRNIRRNRIVLREISAPATFATNLYSRTYARVVALWQRRIDRIMAEYERTLSTMTTDSPADIQRELDEGESEFQRLFVELRPELQDWALNTERWVRGRWRGAVLSATEVDLGTLLGPEDMRDILEAWIARNVALIRDVSAQAQGRIADAVFRGLSQRRPARDVAKDIREAVTMARDRSIRIASHQLSDISNRLADERRREAGIDSWIWVHSKKRNPRPEHQARDGKEYSDRSPPPTLPGSEPFCGCRSRGVLKFG